MTNYEPGLSSAHSALMQVRGHFPPGLVGDIAAFLYVQAPYPNSVIALAGAVGFLAGITGQKYNTPTGIGLNQYILVLAGTGRGKEAIAEGTDRLLQAVVGNTLAGGPGAPGAAQFRLPSHFASAEGLMKHLAGKSACGFSIQGEFAQRLKAMNSPKASPVSAALKAAYLDLYNKAGAGKYLNVMAYSDDSKNTKPVLSPALTLIGESTFDLFDGLDQSAITSGLLTRFLAFQTDAPRPYLNPHVGTPPNPELVERLRDIAAICLSYSATSPAIRVDWDSQAQARFVECERQATDYINANRSNVHAELWNRAYLKALKLASLLAVGVNHHAPTITLDLANYAVALVGDQTNWLAARFDDGDFGEEAGNEAKQRAHIIRIIGEYLGQPFDASRSYKQKEPMHKARIVTHNYILQRCYTLPAFKPKPTKAVEDTIKVLLEADDLARVGHPALHEMFGTTAKAYFANRPSTFGLISFFEP